MSRNFLTSAIIVLSATAFLATASCKKQEQTPMQEAAPAPSAAMSKLPHENLPLGLYDSGEVIPADNPITPEKVELGKFLYFDGRLSRDGTISCASCHHPDFGWSDEGPTSTGIKGQKGGRRAPTVINRLFSGAQFWDGRAASLEEQAKGPIENPIEMGFTHGELVERLTKVSAYGPLFEKAFGSPEVNIDRIAQAIASFERTIVAGNSPFDKYLAGGDQNAVSDEVKRGFEVFSGQGQCTLCHGGMNFTDEMYHNLGVGMNKPDPDIGRSKITQNEADTGAFKTPTLRNLSARAPYMHDGSEATLEAVVDFYNKGGNPNPHLSDKIKPLNLSDQQKSDLVAFLKALDGEVTQVTVPTEFPGGWHAGDAVE